MKELFEENWSCLQCGQCKYFKVDADREDVQSICKRIDHKHVKFSKSYFKSYDCGQFRGIVCREFYPADNCVWLKKHWFSYDDYYQDEKIKGLINFCIDDDFSVRYGVKVEDFINGTMYDESGNLKWVEKMYYKQRKPSKRYPTGYELVREKRTLDGCI